MDKTVKHQDKIEQKFAKTFTKLKIAHQFTSRFAPLLENEQQKTKRMMRSPIYAELDKTEIVDKSLTKNSENIR